MQGIRIGLVNRVREVFLIFIIMLTVSCHERCHSIEDNAYKGYGFFFFENHFQCGNTQLFFIPVCCDLEDLLNFKNLDPQIGLCFFCWGGDSLLMNIAMNSTIVSIDEPTNYEMYITPVYIDFKEAPDCKLDPFGNDVRKYSKEENWWSATLNREDTIDRFTGYCYYTMSDIHNIIDIKKIQFYSFNQGKGRSAPVPQETL